MLRRLRQTILPIKCKEIIKQIMWCTSGLLYTIMIVIVLLSLSSNCEGKLILWFEKNLPLHIQTPYSPIQCLHTLFHLATKMRSYNTAILNKQQLCEGGYYRIAFVSHIVQYTRHKHNTKYGKFKCTNALQLAHTAYCCSLCVLLSVKTKMLAIHLS